MFRLFVSFEIVGRSATAAAFTVRVLTLMVLHPMWLTYGCIILMPFRPIGLVIILSAGVNNRHKQKTNYGE